MLRRLAWLGLATAILGVALLALALRTPRLAVPERGAVLAGVTLVEPDRPPRESQTVTVVGDRIARIEPTPPETVGPYVGKVVAPGLADLHVHLPPVWALGERELFALLFLAHGVTSVRDAGSTLGTPQAFAERVAAGGVPGPRIVHCGTVLDGDPPVWPGARIVRGATEAGPAVEAASEEGARCVKLYNGLSPAAVEAVLREAAARGLGVVGHVPERVSIASLGGVEIQHLMGLATNWWQVGEERIAWYVETSRRLGIAHTPTLVAFDRYAALADYPRLRGEPEAALLPSYHRDILWNPELNQAVLAISPAGGSSVANRVPVMSQALRGLARAGVKIGVGSDAGSPFVVPGVGLHRELALLAEAGFPLERVWALATRGAAPALGVAGLGELREGAPADLLVLGADPTRDLAALASLEAVVADGRLYHRADLEAGLARHRERQEGRVYQALSRRVARALIRALGLQRPPPG